MFILKRRYRYYYVIALFFSVILLFCFNYNLVQKFSKNYFIKNDSSFSPAVTSIPKTTLDCTGSPLQKWCDKINQIHMCNSSLIVFNKLFVRTKSVILERKLAVGKREGGEEMQKVLNQLEHDEYFQFQKGFIQIRCNVSFPIEIFLTKNHLFKIFSSLTQYETQENLDIIDQPTIAVNRYDYVNFYHTITDIYTVYLLCRFFQLNLKSVHILFLDAHPKGNLDRLWSKLFHSYTRLGQLNLTRRIFYKDLIWSTMQSKSELDVDQGRMSAPSYFLDFRQHLLQQFHVQTDRNKKLDCLNLRIFFLLRRNYVAHPRNPQGIIQRQLINEKQILNDFNEKFKLFPSIHFEYNYFEELSLEEQLSSISQTDIFLGIHGAGLTHVLFLKSNRFLIELVPRGREGQFHFQYLSAINQINYSSCTIDNGQPTAGETIWNCLTKKIVEICPKSMT